MSFEDKSTDELIRIVKAGLGFTLDSVTSSAEELHEIAEAACKSGAKVMIIHTPEIASKEVNYLFKSNQRNESVFDEHPAY
jgi:nickel-dependent lactate racemase